MSTQKVWFVTGASKGLGLALVKKLLGKGYWVAATSRKVDELAKAVDTNSENFLPLSLNLTDEADVKKAIAATVAQFGSIDVVVNNAGHGLIGSLEELTDAEARANFEVNVFGALNVVRQVMPQLRQQQSGHIFNISSIGGFTGGYPGFGIYCATKFAMHGFTEALATEVKPFGIHTTLVMPGYFRTNFLDGGSLSTPKNEMSEYKNVREVQTMHQQNINTNQPGDPDKAADAFIALAENPAPPVRLFLESDAYHRATAKIELLTRELEANKEASFSTDYESE